MSSFFFTNLELGESVHEGSNDKEIDYKDNDNEETETSKVELPINGLLFHWWTITLCIFSNFEEDREIPHFSHLKLSKLFLSWSCLWTISL